MPNEIIQSSIFDPLIPYIEVIESETPPYITRVQHPIRLKITIKLPSNLRLSISELSKYFYDDYEILLDVCERRKFTGTIKDNSLAMYLVHAINEYNQ